MASWYIRSVLLLCVALATSAAARPIELPPGPLTEALALERSRGVERSEALARALVHTARTRPRAERVALLDAAIALDPALIDAHVARARAALASGDVPTAVNALKPIWDALRLDARARARWTERTAHNLHAFLTAMLGALALLHALRGLPLARHTLGEQLGSPTAATLLIVAPCVAALFISIVIGILVVLAVAASFVPRRDRISMAVLALALAALDWSLPAFAPDAVLLDPRTRTARIATLNDGPDADAEQRLAAQKERPAAVELVLGLQARRRGDHQAAHARFLACLRADSTLAAGYVNLANVFFRTQQYERAAAGYRAASALDPRDPIPHANLAQMYIRNLHYAESDHELRAASELGFAAVETRRAAWRDESQPVLDRTLDATQIRALARREAAGDPRAARARVQGWRCDAWRSVRADVAPVLLVAVALLLWSRLRLRGLAGTCPDCGTLVCSHCVAQAPEDDRCNACIERSPRLIARAPMVESKPPARRRISLAGGTWLAGLFPGAADLVRGAHVTAFLGVGAGCAAILVMQAVVAAARLQASPWTLAADGGMLRAAGMTLGFVWLPGLLRLRNRDRSVVRVTSRPAAPGA